ncbi:sporulation-specific protein 22 [Ascochyta lentis]
MAPAHSVAKVEREMKLKAVISFASGLTSRIETASEPTVLTELRTQILHLPLQSSPAVLGKRDELETLGTELWNLSTRLRRDQSSQSGKTKDLKARKSGTFYLLRAYAFLLLDSAGHQMVKGRECKACIRLMKVALKAAKVCILAKEFDSATKVLERAATYEDVMSDERENGDNEEADVAKRLRLEYFAVRTVLAFHQDRLDMSEHMFAKCKQLKCVPSPETAEHLADLFYEIGKQALMKNSYEIAVKWLERALEMLGEQGLEILSPEAGELRLSIIQGLVKANTKLGTPGAFDKAWNLIKLMEADYGDKLVLSLLKLELISVEQNVDESDYYNVLARMIRTIVLNDANFKTIIHHVHKLNDFSNVYACKALDDLITIRLIREENASWIEKAAITRTWISTSKLPAENILEQLQQMFDTVLEESSSSFSASATHAAQTLLWKKVEESSAQEQYDAVEAWCRLCLHPVLEKAGAQNKVKIIRKIIQSALWRQDYVAARSAYCNISEIGRDEPVTRYLMYKVGLRSGDADFASECLEVVCRNSSKDATLLYACVMEAQSVGNKRQAINALGRVLDKYDFTAPAGIHLPALLRPSTLEQQLFTGRELEWFSKNSYNMSLKYCAEVMPQSLVRLLNVCAEFIRLQKEQDHSEAAADLGLRLGFCEFLAACTYTTLARAEDDQEAHLQYYLEVRKHCQEFRLVTSEVTKLLNGAAQDDILSKQLQIVKLELEAVLKLQRWDELDHLFEQCWNCKSSDRYETLADLVLVMHLSLVQSNVDARYRGKVLSMLQKIINLTSRQDGNDTTKLSRWIRCLFNSTLNIDETISLKCLDQATQIAAKKHGVRLHQTSSDLLNSKRTQCPHESGSLSLSIATPATSSPVKLEDDVNPADEESKQTNRYPATELEWLATSSFNRAVDYYLSDNDVKCKEWAEKAMKVAQWLEDDGRLRDLLMGKFSALQFDK